MTDILSSSSQFVLWLCIYVISQTSASIRTRLVIFIPLIALMIWQLVAPISLDVARNIGHPINTTLRLLTVGTILLWLVKTRHDPAQKQSGGFNS